MDVYDGTPTIVTVWLTIVVKLTIFIFLQGLIEISIPETFYNLGSALELGAQVHNPTLNYPVGLEGAITSPPVEGFLVFDSFLTLLEGRGSAPQGFLTQATNFIGGEQIKNLLLISSLLSLLVGTIGGLSQIKIKRLLAFSSISHVGFLLLALGIYTQNSVDSFIFYLVQYTITSLNIFLILLALGYNRLADKSLALSRLTNANEIEDSKYHVGPPADINYLIELKGQLYKNPVLSISLAICLFSMAGIPPLIGFFSKQFVLFSSIENGNNFLSIIAILVSVISASYYLKVIKITFFDNPSLSASVTHNTVPECEESFIIEWRGLVVYSSQLSNFHSYIIAILTFLILLFFLDPSVLLNGTQLISLIIFNL